MHRIAAAETIALPEIYCMDKEIVVTEENPMIQGSVPFTSRA
jgi:hypothetical protein